MQQILISKWTQVANICGVPGGSDSKESACNAGDVGSIPGSGRSQKCNPPQYSCLENSRDREAWWATVSNKHVHTHTHTYTHTESVSPFHHGHNIFYTPLLGQYLPKGKEKSQELQHTPGIFSVKLIRKESTTISLPNPSKLNMLISVHLSIN